MAASRRSATTATVLRLAAAAILSTAALPAIAADISVFSSGAPAEAEKAIAAGFAQRGGDKIQFAVATPRAIRTKLSAGEIPDVVVLPAPVIGDLEKAQALRPRTGVPVARVGIGVVVRAGAPTPDIASADAIRKLLLDAKSVAISDPAGGGFAGLALQRMFEQLGIADAVKSKLTIRNAIDGGVDLVAKGEIAVGLFNISEIITVKGISLVGPLPPNLQSYIVFTAAIHAGSASPGPAAAFIKALADPAASQHWRAAGLEPIPTN